uniref:SFRICE_013827 n=1 Tax=Spodoptera frugiperda TaxID=7108 RepID=A0A2H1V1V5_SPOFR
MSKIRIRQKEVYKTLRNLDVSKASGPDGIPAVVLKCCAPELSPILTRLFRLSLETGQVPVAWKLVNVQPVPKKVVERYVSDARTNGTQIQSLRESMVERLNSSLMAVSDWGDANLVKFNVTKTQACLFSAKLSQFPLAPTFRNVSVPISDHLELLGVTLLPTLNFGSYIESKAQLAGRKLGILWRVRRYFTPEQLPSAGGYEDDVDHGNEFTYTGSGGRDLSGNKRTAEQSCDQTLTRENKALARNCAVNSISEEGGDAGDNWRNGKPVRVVRSYKMLKHFPKYAPKEGIRYDGIYKVVKYYPEKGLSGFIVWKYLLRRDDPNPAPWEPGAKEYPIIYPDGYLEAEAEKKALKEKNSKGGKGAKKGSKKRALRESNQTTESESDASPPVKKRKTTKVIKTKATKSPKTNIASIFLKSPNRKSPRKKDTESKLSEEEMAAVKADTLNEKLWSECLVVCEARGKKEFVEYVTQMFLCIICQEVAVTPVTTPCLHNFCLACLRQAFKASGAQCPCCRHSLIKYEIEPNEELKTALRSILAGYDAGKK